MGPLLEVEDLTVRFHRRGAEPYTAVDAVSFIVEAGQTLGVVGESGCGKSVTSLAIMGLLPKRGVRVSGEVRFEETDLLRLSSADLRDRRGRDIGMIFQDPLSSLNPVVPIGVQVGEVLRRHRGMDRPAARKESARLLDAVGIPDPTRRLKEYPHQLSGGMRQRALIAIALACAPRLLIADEPTTALDVTIQAQILSLLQELVQESGTALMLITHDLGVVAGLCDTVTVLYAGRVVESTERHRLFAEPRHPYTHGLLDSVPRLDAPRGAPLHPIRGSVNDNIPWAHGCAFAPRCDNVIDPCIQRTPELTSDGARLLRCYNPVGEGGRGVPVEVSAAPGLRARTPGGTDPGATKRRRPGDR
jgi:peptide/nickel transport system ATP-binding protein